MNVKKVLAGAMVGSALVFGAAGLGGGVANAAPAAPAPLNPHDDPCGPPWCGNGPGWNRSDWNRGDWNGGDWNRGDWNRGDWDRGQWWATNRHDWWDDRNGAPPWGWRFPPPWQWDGGPPHPFNYWGYNVNPVWDDGFHQWGFWLFGLWIPIFGIG